MIIICLISDYTVLVSVSDYVTTNVYFYEKTQYYIFNNHKHILYRLQDKLFFRLARSSNVAINANSAHLLFSTGNTPIIKLFHMASYTK